jgi:hypothetical protein
MINLKNNKLGIAMSLTNISNDLNLDDIGATVLHCATTIHSLRKLTNLDFNSMYEVDNMLLSFCTNSDTNDFDDYIGKIIYVDIEQHCRFELRNIYVYMFLDNIYAYEVISAKILEDNSCEGLSVAHLCKNEFDNFLLGVEKFDEYFWKVVNND